MSVKMLFFSVQQQQPATMSVIGRPDDVTGRQLPVFAATSVACLRPVVYELDWSAAQFSSGEM